MTTYILAGGCFWCLDAVYRRIKGVSEVLSGYAGGTVENPDYFDVASGTTGHAEAVQVTFDEKVISPATILDIFFLIHDPTTPNRQGNDVGSQYRSALFYKDDAQLTEFQAAIDRSKQHWGNAIVTELTQLKVFYPAEDEHQDYFNKNPEAGYCQIIIAPKIAKARAQYAQWLMPA